MHFCLSLLSAHHFFKAAVKVVESENTRIIASQDKSGSDDETETEANLIKEKRFVNSFLS